MKNPQPNENAPGYRFCGVCNAWLPETEFRASRLSHDGLAPICHKHCTYLEHGAREARAAAALANAGARARSPLAVTDPELFLLNERNKKNQERALDRMRERTAADELE